MRITGRKKDLIITAGGKNIAPSAIEGLIATSKYINQVCAIGDRKPYLVALITVDAENVQAYAQEQGIEGAEIAELMVDEKIVSLIDAELEMKNTELASYETIKKCRLVDEFTIENGLLTPTMKVKRNVAMERYEDLIEGMYEN